MAYKKNGSSPIEQLPPRHYRRYFAYSIYTIKATRGTTTIPTN
ncbi:hypothetical protein [uncultured Megasphaera sp.]|nr:hypothetical protein [uncultured Megasphaera sp.]